MIDPSPPRRRQRDRRAAADARMVDAAIALIAERGFGGLVLGEVAARAGFSATLPVHYYRTKEGLILHVARAILADYDAVMRPRLEGLSGLDAIRAFVRCYFDHAREQPHRRRAFLLIAGEAAVHPALRDEVAALTELSAAGLTAMIRDGQRSGTIEPLVDADLFGTLILGWVRGAVSLWALDPALDLARTATAIEAAVVRALRDRALPPPALPPASLPAEG